MFYAGRNSCTNNASAIIIHRKRINHRFCMPAFNPLLFSLIVSMFHDYITVKLLTKWHNLMDLICSLDSELNSYVSMELWSQSALPLHLYRARPAVDMGRPKNKQCTSCACILKSERSMFPL